MPRLHIATHKEMYNYRHCYFNYNYNIYFEVKSFTLQSALAKINVIKYFYYCLKLELMGGKYFSSLPIL